MNFLDIIEDYPSFPSEKAYYDSMGELISQIEQYIFNWDNNEVIYFNHEDLVHQIKKLIDYNKSLSQPRKLKSEFNKNLSNILKTITKATFKYHKRPYLDNFVQYQEFTHHLSWYIDYYQNKAISPFVIDYKYEVEVIKLLTKQIIGGLSHLDGLSNTSAEMIFPPCNFINYQPKKLTYTRFLSLSGVIKSKCYNILHNPLPEPIEGVKEKLEKFDTDLIDDPSVAKMSVYQAMVDILNSLRELVCHHPSLIVELSNVFKPFAMIRKAENCLTNAKIVSGWGVLDRQLTRPPYQGVVERQSRIELGYLKTSWLNILNRQIVLLSDLPDATNYYPNFYALNLNQHDYHNKKMIPIFFQGVPLLFPSHHDFI